MFTFRQKVVLNDLIRGVHRDGNNSAHGSGDHRLEENQVKKDLVEIYEGEVPRRGTNWMPDLLRAAGYIAQYSIFNGTPVIG
jgi:hypothetical protein